MEHFFSLHALDLLLIILGFFIGLTTRFKLPLMAIIMLVKLIKLYMDSLPHKIRKYKHRHAVG